MRKATTSLVTRASGKPATTTKLVTSPPPAASTTGSKPAVVRATAAKPKLLTRPKPKPKPKPAPKPIETPLVGPPVVVPVPVPTPEPVAAPTTNSTSGPLHQIPPESPAPPMQASGENVAPPVPGKPSIVEWSITGTEKPPTEESPAIIEWAANGGPPAASDAALPAGYAVVESDAQKPGYAVVESEVRAESDTTDLPLIAPPIPAVEASAPPAESSATGLPLAPGDTAPSVPTVSIPPGQGFGEVSSVQIGDTLILVMKIAPVVAIVADTDAEVTP